MYKRRARGWEKHLDFIILDCLCLAVAYVLACWFRHGVFIPFGSMNYRDLFIVVEIMNFVAIIFLDTMKNVLKRGYWKELAATMKQGFLVFLCTTAYLFGTKSSAEYSRIAVTVCVLIYMLLTYVVRIGWKHWVTLMQKRYPENALLILASETRAKELIDRIKEQNLGKHQLVGVVIPGEDRVGEKIGEVPIVATMDTLVEYATGHWVDEIMISMNPEELLSEEMIEDLILMGVTIHWDLRQAVRTIRVKQDVGKLAGSMVVSSSMNTMTPRQSAMKRVLDIAGGLVGCLITGILYLILAPKIKKESPGPVFFTQQRIGKNGKPFKMYKFRSMYLDAEERKAELMAQNRLNDNLMFKLDFDPRVIGNKIDAEGNQKTGIGEFIRKYSLDEFPQFFNVLKGDMSMVGTRPPLVDEYEAYSARHKARLATKPGITGMWQVSGRSDILDFDEVVRLDTEYINNWNVGLDLKILFKTVMVVVKKEGSM